MMNKATYKYKVRDRNGYAVHLFYEYRGHEYMVTDEHNGYSQSMWEKHREEQQRIDRMIEDKEQSQKQPQNDTESCDWWEVFNAE